MIEINNQIFDQMVSRGDIFFIQIGANNGISFDPIYNLVKKYKWSGILIEPGEVAFEELLKNYEGHNNLTFVKAAISDYDGKGKLFCGTTTPHFTLSKLKAEHMFDVVPTEVEVDMMSPRTIVEKYDVKKLDLLQIDVEGHDFTIIKAFPFDIVKPRIIRFEYINLFYDNTNAEESEIYLKKLGYTCYSVKDEGDIVAILD